MARLIERGWDDGRFLAEETSEALPGHHGRFRLLVAIDELNRAQVLAEAMLADARRAGRYSASWLPPVAGE